MSHDLGLRRSEEEDVLQTGTLSDLKRTVQFKNRAC